MGSLKKGAMAFLFPAHIVSGIFLGDFVIIYFFMDILLEKV